MPADIFTGTIPIVREAIDDGWSEMVRRVPDLEVWVGRRGVGALNE